jgi:hypothetical protein
VHPHRAILHVRNAWISEVSAAPHPPFGHLLPVNGEKAIARPLSPFPAPSVIGEIIDDGIFRPVYGEKCPAGK